MPNKVPLGLGVETVTSYPNLGLYFQPSLFNFITLAVFYRLSGCSSPFVGVFCYFKDARRGRVVSSISTRKHNDQLCLPAMDYPWFHYYRQFSISPHPFFQSCPVLTTPLSSSLTESLQLCQPYHFSKFIT